MKPRYLLLPLALCFTALAAHAQLYTFSFELDPGQEPSMPVSSGFGEATGSFDLATYALTLDFAFAGLSAPTVAAHIHVAPPGVNGPIIIPLTLTPLGSTFGSSHFEGMLTEEQAMEMIAGNTYVNVHTTVYPGGEIRGQIPMAEVPLPGVPEPSTYALFGAGALLVGIAVRRLRHARAKREELGVSERATGGVAA